MTAMNGPDAMEYLRALSMNRAHEQFRTHKNYLAVKR